MDLEGIGIEVTRTTVIMRLIAITILIFICVQALAQNEPLTFTNYERALVLGKDTFYSQRIHEVVINPDSTFDFWCRPHSSCLTWQHFKGIWKQEKDTLVFSENLATRTTKGVIQNNTLTIVSTTRTKTTLPNDYQDIKFAPGYTLSNAAANQYTPLSIHQIDSLAAIIDSTKGLRTAISDGEVRPAGKRKPKGGFSDTYYVRPITNQLLMVFNEIYFSTTDLTTYYFYKGSLILVKMTSHNKDRLEIMNGRYYFNNGVLFNKQEEGKPLSKPEVFMQHAARYLKDAKTMFIH